ncbi:MAG: segregation/condensation protein A [Clostridia bacterium]|jgi:segregation and condensation protein A|nr:segregation/condensation protein A [Clostridia bacterium]MBT7122565.1 segregation/condensation protein A [Clostridia bacterium]
MNTIEYKVKIEQFHGPLDLLLHLVGKARIDIEEIFVSKVTGQYLSYVASMDTLSMDRASEFLEMAAMLVYIKSRMILPANEFDEDMEEDPELDLIARLKEYKTFKDASVTLKEYEGGARKAFFKLPEEVAFPDEHVILEEMTMDALIEAFAEVLARVPDTAPEHIDEVAIHHDIFTIKNRSKYILRTLSEIGSATFSSLFSDASSKMEVAVTFIALLELMHENIVTISQTTNYEDIKITQTRKAKAV